MLSLKVPLNRSPQPSTTKPIEHHVDQNTNSELPIVVKSAEKNVKLPNGMRTVWKDQSYTYATGTFKPYGLCTKEKPGRNHIVMIHKIMEIDFKPKVKGVTPNFRPNFGCPFLKTDDARTNRFF